MKKLSIFLLMLVFLLLPACGNSDGNENQQDSAETQAEALPPDLTGEWKQINSASEESYQSATIQDDVIEIFWVDDTTETTSLYWSGSFVPPADTTEPYTWDSVNDKEKTETALLASGDETKTFTYENGQISYSASMLGTTQTIRLEKQE